MKIRFNLGENLSYALIIKQQGFVYILHPSRKQNQGVAVALPAGQQSAGVLHLIDQIPLLRQ